MWTVDKNETKVGILTLTRSTEMGIGRKSYISAPDRATPCNPVYYTLLLLKTRNAQCILAEKCQ